MCGSLDRPLSLCRIVRTGILRSTGNSVPWRGFEFKRPRKRHGGGAWYYKPWEPNNKRKRPFQHSHSRNHTDRSPRSLPSSNGEDNPNDAVHDDDDDDDHCRVLDSSMVGYSLSFLVSFLRRILLWYITSFFLIPKSSIKIPMTSQKQKTNKVGRWKVERIQKGSSDDDNHVWRWQPNKMNDEDDAQSIFSGANIKNIVSHFFFSYLFLIVSSCYHTIPRMNWCDSFTFSCVVCVCPPYLVRVVVSWCVKIASTPVSERRRRRAILERRSAGWSGRVSPSGRSSPLVFSLPSDTFSPF